MARWSEEKRARVRQEILEAARAAFEEQGFEGTTMRAIAGEAGLAVGTLFNYFEGKHSLLYAALYEDLEETIVAALAVIEAQRSAPIADLFAECGGVFYDYYCARPKLSIVLLREAMFPSHEVTGSFREQVERVAQALGQQLTRRQARGELRAQADIQQILIAYLSHYYFVLLLDLGTRPDPEQMRQRLRALATQLIEGVGPAPGETTEEQSG